MSHRVLRYFGDILTDYGATFPKSDVSCSASISRRALFDDFKGRLLAWWGGRDIGFTPDGYPKVVGKKLMLPLNVHSKKELYSKLIVATFNIHGQQRPCVYGGSDAESRQ
jgi:hypothetical protein